MTEAVKIKLWKRTQAQRDKFLKPVRGMTTKALNKQIEPVLKAINASSWDGMTERVDRLITEEAIEKLYQEIYSLVVPYFAQRSYDQISKSLEAAMTLKASNEDWTRDTQTALDLYGAERITSITGTSRDKAIGSIRNSLDQIHRDGLGASQAEQLMRDNLKRDWGDISMYRSQRIARTEIAGASNFGSLVGAKKSSQEYEEPMFKVWLSTRDSRTRRRKPKHPFDHAIADGEQRELEEPFVKTGEELDYPADFNGSAGNVIHCRCTVMYEPKELDETGDVDVMDPPVPPPSLEEEVRAMGKARSLKQAQDHFKKVLPQMEDVDFSGCHLEVANNGVLAADRIKKAGWNLERLDKLAPLYKYSRPQGRAPLAWASKYQGFVEYNKSYFKDPSKMKGYGGKDSYFLTKTKAGLELQQTWTHEIGHVIFSDTADELLNYGLTHETVTQLKSVKRRYMTKVGKAKREAAKLYQDRYQARISQEQRDRLGFPDYKETKAMQRQAAKEVYLDQDWFISEYASKNINEFWAESFANVMVGNRVSSFAQEAVDVMKRNPVFFKP